MTQLDVPKAAKAKCENAVEMDSNYNVLGDYWGLVLLTLSHLILSKPCEVHVITLMYYNLGKMRYREVS